MDRRNFLELSVGGIAGALVPVLPFDPSLDELLTKAVGFSEAGHLSAIMTCGKAVGCGELLPKERLMDALQLYHQALPVYEEARRRFPQDLIVLEEFANCLVGMARVETLMGLSARDRIADGLSCAEKWIRLAPDDPAAARVREHHRADAGRLLELASNPMPALLPHDTLFKAFGRTA